MDEDDLVGLLDLSIDNLLDLNSNTQNEFDAMDWPADLSLWDLDLPAEGESSLEAGDLGSKADTDEATHETQTLMVQGLHFPARRKRKVAKKRVKAMTKKEFETIRGRMLTLNRNSIFQGKYEEIIRVTKIEDECEVDIEGVDCPPILPKPATLDRPLCCDAPPFDPRWNERRRLPDSKYTIALRKTLDEIYSLPPPSERTRVDPDVPTSEEMRLFPEFFKHRKGARRYMTIRNHIVKKWSVLFPKYLTKTVARTGLKNCGDVNGIGKVFAFLEQKGIINFGCEQCHYNQKGKR
ncbi:uncharacterized protein LOC106667454 [Cimex lectularius]|uniref:SWIRM domain-containing protein n=1 Tax=Cimex lectularius TaxID=79782 RepID=A0A8I6TEY0_CIMLE|nr:uncharacterized protein LOC106667454 [Cimex lectularius]